MSTKERQIAVRGATREATIALTWGCAYDCHFCRFHEPRSAPPPSVADPRGTLRRELDEGARRVTFSGGEPATCPDLEALIREAAAAGALVALETNGAAFADPGLAGRLAAAGLSAAVVLYPSDEPQRYALLTRHGRFERFLEGVDRLSAEVDVSLNIPVGQWNAAALPGMVARALKRWPNLTEIRLTPLDPGATPQEMLAQVLPWRELGPWLIAAWRAGAEAGIEARLAPGTALPYCLASPELPPAWFQAHERRTGHLQGTACGECAIREHCRGVGEAYSRRFGFAGIRPVNDATVFTSQTAQFRTHLEGKYDAALQAAEPDIDRWGTFQRKTVVLRVNGACNIRCVHCWVDFDRPDARFAEMEERVREAAAQGVHELAFSGGEPTMYEGLERLIALARDLGIPSIELQTNAMRCKDPAYARLMRECGVTKAFTTLLGSSEDVARRAAGTPKAFTDTVAGLHAMCEAGISSSINYVINRVNLADVPDFARFYDREFHRRHDNIELNICVAQPINALSVMSPQWERTQRKFSAAGAPPAETPVPTFPELRGPLMEALDYLLERGIEFHGLNSLSGVPLCVLGADQRYFPRKHRWKGRHMEKIFTKLPQCSECSVERLCLGVRRNYLDLHGPEGIVPVAEEI